MDRSKVEATTNAGSAALGRSVVLLLPVALYLAGVNAYALPDTFDNIVYLAGAKALVDTGAFTFGGWYVWDWPPGLSVVLGGVRLLGFDSIVAAKLVVVASVAFAIFSSRTILARGGWKAPVAASVIFALAPYAFLQGTRVMSDWPYLAASFAFFLALGELRERRTLALAVLVGLLLGASALVRHVGAILGIALVAQAWLVTRGSAPLARIRNAWPELLASALGGGLFVAWKLHLLPYVRAGAAWSEYQQGSGFLFHPDVLHWARLFLDVLFHGASLGSKAHLPALLIGAVALVVTAIVLLGLVDQARARGLTPELAYIAANLVLVLCLEWKWSRYLLPVAPFLVSAGCRGVAFLAERFAPAPSRGKLRSLAVPALVAWALGLAALDGVVLVRGNGSTHGALSPLLSHSAAEFYRGEWRDVEGACAIVRGDGVRADPRRGAVLWLGRDDLKYPAFWCERPVVQGKAVQGKAIPADGTFWTKACELAPPYIPGTGLALDGADGRAMPLLTERRGGHSTAPGCGSIDFVVRDPRVPLPAGGPALAPLGRSGALEVSALSR
jgi:hypothetical protein